MSTRDAALDHLYDAVCAGEATAALAAAEEALDAGAGAEMLLFEAMIPALEEVGSRFEAGEVFLPEMLIAARAMQAVMDRIRPLIVEAGVEKAGRFLIGTVAGDIHDVGKKLVGVMLVGAGFAHNFSLASSPAGPGVYGPAGVMVGLVFCALIGLTMREPAKG